MNVKERGQGLVEYALVLVLVAVLVIAILAIIGSFGNSQSTPEPTPPAMDAPMLDIVRWCESHARDTYTTTSLSPVMVGKIMMMQPRTQTHTKDSPDKFVTCMQGYEYVVRR